MLFSNPAMFVFFLSPLLSSKKGHNFMRQNGNWKDRSDKPTDFSVWYGCGGHVYNVSYRGKRPDWTDMHSTSQWAVFSRWVLNPGAAGPSTAPVGLTTGPVHVFNQKLTNSV